MTGITKETTGAWIIHHGRKLSLDANGSAEFPVLDEAAKAADLLCRLGASDTAQLCNGQVEALARSARLSPRLELPSLLKILEDRRLISRSPNNTIEIIGITTRAALGHAAEIFEESSPTVDERAAIDIAEISSAAPVSCQVAMELIGDKHRMARSAVNDFLLRAEQVGFIDAEGDGASKLLFNGNLFRRQTIDKTTRVLSSLSAAEQRKVNEFSEYLKSAGCVNAKAAEKMLEPPLFEKLKAAGMYDLNTVSNESGENVYVTAPDAFHKFVDPLVDDSFDMAKALASALTYGMTERSSSHGRIMDISLLLKKLIRGSSVGPATAIGNDYRVLEQNRVVEITPDPRGLFNMKLLKKDVGELALKVLTTGSANDASLTLPSAPMKGYIGPEGSRTAVRKQQNPASKRATQDILSALRGGRK